MQTPAKRSIRFHNRRALEFFRVMGDWWRTRRGFYASLIPPQRKWLPEDVKDNPVRFGWWLFFMAIPMRGGINSDDAFRFVFELYGERPDLFDPYLVKNMKPEEVHLAAKKVAKRIHPGGSQGDKEEGTFSMNSDEHAEIWVENARRLVERWGGDIRNVFWGVGEFEEAFRRIDHKRNRTAGFKGMRRKIFSLLTEWLQEFGLIPEFPLPLIIDFHAIRLLLEHRILLVEYQPLGPGNPRKKERKRPESMWHYPALRINEKLVDEIIMWSQRFLLRHGLVQYDVAHGMWFLSRELCKYYYGNRAIEKRMGGRRTVTERLITDSELKTTGGWPLKYRDPCRLCPVENTCKVRIPAGPCFDWGVMVNAGKHFPFPGRAEMFSIITREMPASFGRRNGRGAITNGNVRKEDASRQFDLGSTEET